MMTNNGSNGPPDPVDQSPAETIDDLTSSLREALAEDHPLPFLAHASSLLQAIGPHSSSDAPETPDPETILGAFVGSGDPTMQAMAYAITRLGDDQLLREKIDRELGSDVRQLPDWLGRLDAIRPTTALQSIDPACAGANIAVGVDLAGHPLTIVGFIDFDLGSALTDGYVLDVPPEEYARMWSLMGATSTQDPVDLADARARWEAGIRIGDQTEPPYENDTWPACRPIIESVLRTLPGGGADFPTHQLTDTERRELITAVRDSDQLGSLRGDPDVEAIVDLLLDFRAEHNDPLLWSVKAVEIFLTHYAPRRLLAPRSFMIKFPAVLQATINSGHQLRTVSAEVTSEAVDAVSQHTPAYEAALEQRDQLATGDDDFAATLREMLGHDRTDPA